MRVKIGPYRSWIGPYQIASGLFFWYPKTKDEHGFETEADFIHDFGEWLAEDRHGNDSWLMKLCNWIQSKKQRKIKIHIDRWDSWNAHNTASLILYPLFQQLKETKHGSGFVDDEDVPEHLRSTNAVKDEYGTDSLFHERWDWVFDEILFALRNDNFEWEEMFQTGEYDLQSEVCERDENGKPTLYKMVEGPNHTIKTDWEGREAYQKRIDNGFRLMGKYWQNLWD